MKRAFTALAVLLALAGVANGFGLGLGNRFGKLGAPNHGSVSSGGGITQIQKNGGTIAGNASIVTAFGTATIAGHSIIIFVNDAGTVLTPAGFTSRSPQVNNQGFYLFDKLVASGDATDTPTLTASGAYNGIWFIAEYSGITSFDTSNGSNGGFASITSETTASITPTAGARLLIASIGGTANAFADTYAAGDPQGWTNSFTGQQSAQQTGTSGTGLDSIMSGWAAQLIVADGATAFTATASFSITPGGASTAPANIISSYTGSSLASIPLSFSDPRFASNTAGVGGEIIVNGTRANLNWNENPGYASGNQCFTFEGTLNTDILKVSQSTVDWREGPRLASNPTGTLSIDQSFISTVGKTGDHADGIQAFAGTNVGGGTLNVTNTTIRSYTDAEALSTYGAGYIGSDAMQYADGFGSSSVSFINLVNDLIWGGSRGLTIDVDSGATVHVSLDHVYFVPSPDGWTFYPYLIQSTGGTLIVDKWNEVRAATIVGGVIVPGALLPSP